jgi:ribosomal protein S18 acetylase RimI-like enzyme
VRDESRPDVLRMRAELVPAHRRPTWPPGVHVRTWRSRDAASVHALLVHGYRGGGGSVKPFDDWLAEITGDEEFDPALCFVAASDRGLAGTALCWTSAFVKDLVVHESWRRRGLGEALLLSVFASFADRGADAVELKVESTNLGARRLYERVGFRVTERLPAS